MMTMMLMMMMMTEEFGEKQAQASGPDLVDKVPGFARVRIISNLTTTTIIIIIISIIIIVIICHHHHPHQHFQLGQQ